MAAVRRLSPWKEAAKKVTILNADQFARATRLAREWLEAPPAKEGLRPMEIQAKLDRDRLIAIDQVLNPLLEGYLGGGVTLPEFKSKVDGFNKKHEYWGFKGIKGQMFFNMVVNTARASAECDLQIKRTITEPANNDGARSAIQGFSQYVQKLGEEHTSRGGGIHGRPKLGSLPFFVSYFWQVQNNASWPVFYTNSTNVMSDLNLWIPTGDLAEDYMRFKQIHEELAKEFSSELRRDFSLYDVEHVFWYKGGNPYGGNKPVQRIADAQVRETAKGVVAEPAVFSNGGGLPDSFVPPVVSVLPSMARNDSALLKAAEASGTSIERAFEKHVNIAWSILGFEAQLLGQGKGRVPDGRAVDSENAYAIIWDAKARTNGYSLGTDDRAIREYITTQSRDLKKSKGIKNIYYAIVSGSFPHTFGEEVRSLKMETGVNEVLLLEAEALVTMVELKLRDPREISLGPEGLQQLFSTSGILNAELVRQLLQ